MRFIKSLMVFGLALQLAACGGGGGGGNSLYNSNPSSGATTTATVASITLDLGGKTSVSNSGSETVTATVTAKDANNVVVSGATVAVRADSGDVSILSATTDSKGQATATVTIGDDKSNRTIQVTATAGSLSQTKSFRVTGSAVNATAVPSVIAPGGSGEIQYQVVDVNGNALRQQSITVSSSVGSATALTDNNGVYTYAYTAPAATGDVVFTATSAGATQQETVTVQPVTGASKPSVTPGVILSAFVEANPSVVTVNEPGQSSNRAAIRALFTGANNASIQNVRVRFDLAGDANSVGGTLSSGSSIVYSDANGEASTFYVPATKASPTNGVTVRACYGYTDTDMLANACPNEATVTLTVVSGAISVSITSDGKLIELNNGLQLAQDFAVTVNDSAGRAKGGVDLVPSIDLLSYAKGSWSSSSGGDSTSWSFNPTQSFWDNSGNYRPTYEVDPLGPCLNEDRNRNGILEAAEDSVSLAYTKTQGGNGNGMLDPRKSDVLITINDGVSAKTDTNGFAKVRIIYGRSVAGWLKYNILVAASGISGTEGRASWVSVLRVPVDDLNQAGTPAFVDSPYGVQAGCQNRN